MARWHHQFQGDELEQTLGEGEVQGGLVCCSPWVCKELDRTEQMNNTEYSDHSIIQVQRPGTQGS